MQSGSKVAKAHDEKINIAFPVELLLALYDWVRYGIRNWVRASPTLKSEPLVRVLVGMGYFSNS